MKVGYGECCRHAIVGTVLLRANGIPARTVCGLWAVDEKSKGGHCWTEFFLDGVGWVPCDTTYNNKEPKSDDYFGSKQESPGGNGRFRLGDRRRAVRQVQRLPVLDAFPAYWSKGKGVLGEPKVEATESVKVVKRLRRPASRPKRAANRVVCGTNGALGMKRLGSIAATLIVLGCLAIGCGKKPQPGPAVEEVQEQAEPVVAPPNKALAGLGRNAASRWGDSARTTTVSSNSSILATEDAPPRRARVLCGTGRA